MLLTGRKVTDSQTGFRVITKNFFDKLSLEADNYKIRETEITVKSLLVFLSKEVPVTVT
jgi:hypothetical protein